MSAFASVLARRREEYNARFRLARHRSRALEPAEFLAHLRDAVGPVVDGLPAGVDPEPVCDALVELSLALGARGRLSGPFADGFARLLPAAAVFVAAQPRRVPAAVVNALHHLAAAPTGDPTGWTSTMVEIAGNASTVDELLDAGAVAAWRHGLARLRPAAMDVADRLDGALLGLALGSAVDDGLVDRLAADPWLDPGSRGRPVLLLARRVGGFRGFGGAFRRPPTVSTSDGRWYATDGDGAWRVFADRFGVGLHRVDAVPAPAGGGELRLVEGGVVADRATGAELVLPELAAASSWASSGGTLAATTPWTHGILFVARTAG